MSDKAYFQAINNTDPRGANRILWDAELHITRGIDIYKPVPEHLRDALRILGACRVLVALTETWDISEEVVL